MFPRHMPTHVGKQTDGASTTRQRCVYLLVGTTNNSYHDLRHKALALVG